MRSEPLVQLGRQTEEEVLTFWNPILASWTSCSSRPAHFRSRASRTRWRVVSSCSSWRHNSICMETTTVAGNHKILVDNFIAFCCYHERVFLLWLVTYASVTKPMQCVKWRHRCDEIVNVFRLHCGKWSSDVLNAASLSCWSWPVAWAIKTRSFERSIVYEMFRPVMVSGQRFSLLYNVFLCHEIWYICIQFHLLVLYMLFIVIRSLAMSLWCLFTYVIT